MLKKQNDKAINMINQSSRVALSAYLHDLGKFAERAGIPVPKETLDTLLTQYCPFRQEGGYFTHRHAAFTAFAFDTIEKNAPDLIKGDVTPFASRTSVSDITDSMVNAASAHHKPATLLQWLVATADRVASGFERETFEKYNLANEQNKETGRNHFQARQLTLFEQIRLNDAKPPANSGALKFRYPLKPLSPNAIFPVARNGYEPDNDQDAKAEYRQLWDGFVSALDRIPRSHRANWPLWLDHFDSLWLTYTQAIPSATAFGTRPEVSLYDHSKTTASLAVALWRWHEAHPTNEADAIRALSSRQDWDTQKILLIQGDFFGIQDFIFADGRDTNKAAARLLRGRSFQVSLLTELAALSILESCGLPSTSQITNAAGKFLIVAPNTADVREALETTRKQLDTWFLKHSQGMAGIGIAIKAASCNDFIGERFPTLVDSLFADLAEAKLHRFNLLADNPAVLDCQYLEGCCSFNNRLPAKGTKDGLPSAPLSRDQIRLGTELARKSRLLVLKDKARLAAHGVTALEVDIFGYHVAFTDSEEETGKFGELAGTGGLSRCWDFSLPASLDETLWHGYARRFINAYVPYFREEDIELGTKYGPLEEEARLNFQYDAGKTLNHIACEDRHAPASPDRWIGQTALSTVKGDVDNLGKIFQRGLNQPTFAKMAGLSRQLNAFFAIWLPAYCQHHYPNTYTVFAGGDDFFLIGPWFSTQKLAADMQQQFARFVAENPDISFSAGLVMSKPGHPIHTLATQAEQALSLAKEGSKNAIVLFGQRVPWSQWPSLQQAASNLASLVDEMQHAGAPFSISYLYSLLQLVDLAEKEAEGDPSAAIWRSRLAYRTRRYVVDKLKPASRDAMQQRLMQTLVEQGITAQKGAYRIPLFNHFYRLR